MAENTQPAEQFNLSALTDLTGRVALVTGGGTGIGLMIAKGLATHGAKVYITGRRVEVLQDAAQAQFTGQGHLVSLQMDVTDKASIQRAVQAVSDNDGKLDILVNNAGDTGAQFPFISDVSAPENASLATYGKALFNAQSFEDWADLSSLNVTSVFFVTSAFLGLLEASTKGRPGASASVINISSIAAHVKLPLIYYAYVALKAATKQLTRILATDFALKQFPIRVNAIAPGVFPSKLTATEEQLEEITKTSMVFQSPIPLRRAGRQHEMAAAAVYLASPASSYTNGHELLVDGGVTLVNP